MALKHTDKCDCLRRIRDGAQALMDGLEELQQSGVPTVRSSAAAGGDAPRNGSRSEAAKRAWVTMRSRYSVAEIKERGRKAAAKAWRTIRKRQAEEK